MPPKEGMPSVREHADKVISDLIARGDIAPDSNAAKLAAGIPAFSKGTLAQDPETGALIGAEPTLPGFSNGQVAMPEATTEGEAVGAKSVPPAETPPSKTPEELIAEHRQRLEGGAPPETAPPVQPAPAEEVPAAQQAGAAAAEAAAADIWADAEDFEFEDPSVGVKIPLRVPKRYAESAKRGYGARSRYDRATAYLQNASPVLRPLIEDGRINPILPMLQAALDDPNGLGEQFIRMYERYQRGQPLIEQARQEATAAGAPTPQVAPFDQAAMADPFLAEQLTPIQQQLQAQAQRLEAFERQQSEQRERDRQQAEQQRRTAADMMAAHQDLARMYPDQTRVDLGAQDPFWLKASKYAGEAGYVNQYGIRAGVLFGAQQVMALEQERLNATASPAAAALNANEQSFELARQQAAAASRTVGAGAPVQAPPPPPPQKPSTRNPDGSKKDAGQFLREAQAYVAATGQAVTA